MAYEKSKIAFKEVDEAAGREHRDARKMWRESQDAEEKGLGATAHFAAHVGNKADERATRLGKVSNYLSRRSSREYGEGHDMAHHGEGKPHSHD